MCIDYPGRVVAVAEGVAVVDTEGRHRRATTLLIGDIAVGDWVTVAAGTIVDRLSPAEAATIRSLLATAESGAAQPRTAPSSPPAGPTTSSLTKGSSR
jgi:hydrogenase assembly chaperone HypC/HupF